MIIKFMEKNRKDRTRWDFIEIHVITPYSRVCEGDSSGGR